MRPHIDEYFMHIAELVSTMGTCDRKRVGCILVKDRRIISTGYNGSMPGLGHCDDIGHLIEDGHCIRTVHAEINALSQCAKYGISCDGSDCYCNTFPCWNCFKALVNSGIKRIFYLDEYPVNLKDNIHEFAGVLGIPIIKVNL